LKRTEEKLLNLQDEQTYYRILEKAKIKCRLVNVFYTHTTFITSYIKDFIEGKWKVSKYDRFLIPWIMFHYPIRSRKAVESVGSVIGRSITNLNNFLDVCYEIFIKMKEKGSVGIKNQSAYERSLNFENSTRGEAEKMFNFILNDPRRSLGWPEVKVLDDYLFHRFLDIAEELSLPVQIHTGHITGILDEIAKANGVQLIPVMELHKNVKFDLLHANWPYAWKILFLAKNYPNVHIDLCWVSIIDPYYTHQFLCDALTSIPHSKIHGFSGDYPDIPEYSVAHLNIAKDVISSVLARMVDTNWISIDEAKEIATDWFLNNPNEFHKLGFQSIK